MIDASDAAGHYSFEVLIQDDWNKECAGTDCELEVIEFAFYVNDRNLNDDSSKDKGGTMVGEPYVLDLKGAQNNLAITSNTLYLDWDYQHPLMKKCISPEHVKQFVNENVPLDILYLGSADNLLYDPVRPLTLHVNLKRYVSDLSDLQVEVFRHIDPIVPSLRKGPTDLVHEAIAKVSETDESNAENNPKTKLDLGAPTISRDDERDGWVQVRYEVVNILSAFVAAIGDEDDITGRLRDITEDDFKNIMDIDHPDRSDEDDMIRLKILEVIQTVTLSVKIASGEDQTKQLISEFLVERLECNNMYYDSAAQRLSDHEINSEKASLEAWSEMMGHSSLTEANCLYRYATFKLTGESSAFDTQDNAIPTGFESFQVSLEIPTTDIDPNDMCLLVQKFDPDVSFHDADAHENFLFLQNPDIMHQGEKNVAVFPWRVLNPSVDDIRDALFKITVIMSTSEPITVPGEDGNKLVDEYKQLMKVGTSSTFVKTVGTRNRNFHTVQMKLRNAITLGIVDTLPIEDASANFMETMVCLLFHMADGKSFFVRSQMENAADDLAEKFHTYLSSAGFTDILLEEVKKCVKNFNLMKYGDTSRLTEGVINLRAGKVVQISSISKNDSFEDDINEDGDSNDVDKPPITFVDALPEFFLGLFKHPDFAHLKSQEMLNEILNSLEEECGQLQDNQRIEFSVKFSELFEMPVEDLGSKLATCPSCVLDPFMDALHLLSAQGDDPNQSPDIGDEVQELVMLATNTEVASQQLDKVLNVEAVPSNARAFQTFNDVMTSDHILDLLENANDACTTMNNILFAIQGTLIAAEAGLGSLQNLRRDFNSMAYNAKRMVAAIGRFVPMVLRYVRMK